MRGEFFAVIAALCFGLFHLFNHRGAHKLSVIWSTFLVQLISAIVLTFGLLLTQGRSNFLKITSVAIVIYSLATITQNVFGLTLLRISQKRMGAPRTGNLVGTSPLFAVIIAAIFLQEIPSLVAFVGILIVVSGIFVTVPWSKRKNNKAISQSESKGSAALQALPGLGAAFFFALSAVFVRNGLNYLPSPLVGLTLGTYVSVIVYFLIMIIGRSTAPNLSNVKLNEWFFLIAAGGFVGAALWFQWQAIQSTPIAVVVALGRLNIPTILLLTPIVLGHASERVTWQVWVSALLIIIGSMILIFFG
jgi:drug/metabolite transporter (DMT)-like permease